MNERPHEEYCARRLVDLLVQRHRLPICIREVRVARNWKTKFRFYPIAAQCAEWHGPLPGRIGRRPGLELDWGRCVGDVDAWQMAGDVASTVLHGWQIAKKWITQREERPSKLLALVEKQPQINTGTGEE